MRYLITIDTDHQLVPANADHLASLFANPNNRNLITSIEVIDV
jgi:hypothetical protein